MLDVGNETASTGMAKNIYDELKKVGYPADRIPTEGNAEYALREAKMKKMCFAISKGIIDHIVANMEIKGVTVELPIGSHIVSVTGGGGAPAIGVSNLTPETHIQNNDGTGLVN